MKSPYLYQRDEKILNAYAQYLAALETGTLRKNKPNPQPRPPFTKLQKKVAAAKKRREEC
jgi:hypothetical protein